MALARSLGVNQARASQASFLWMLKLAVTVEVAWTPSEIPSIDAKLRKSEVVVSVMFSWNCASVGVCVGMCFERNATVRDVESVRAEALSIKSLYSTPNFHSCNARLVCARLSEVGNSSQTRPA